MVVIVLEANQTKDGNIVIPEVLRSYTGFGCDRNRNEGLNNQDVCFNRIIRETV
ncbi:MAG: hypothetical protein R2942_02285 [Ignavibacteria bacterium]